MPKPVPAKAVRSTPAPRPVQALPESLVKNVPNAGSTFQAILALEGWVSHLDRDMKSARKLGAIPLARAFVVLRRLKDRMDEVEKKFSAVFEENKNIALPAAFEDAGITSIPLDEGYRVAVSAQLRASIKPDKKEQAYNWLRKNGLGDIIAETINSSTLSATAKAQMEGENRELPADLFNVAYLPTTSVTSTK
jgi:hypothetical protein